MRYHEIAQPPHYVSTDEEHTGKLNGGETDPCLSASNVESFLEQHRPTDFLPRSESLVVFERPTGARRFCYKVAPLDRVDRHHSGWFTMLAEADPAQIGVISHYAEMFWKGIECPDHRSEPWELRTSSVEIIERIGGSARDIVYPIST